MSQAVWLQVHTSWLIERLGEPNGPPEELVMAWVTRLGRSIGSLRDLATPGRGHAVSSDVW